MWTAENVPHIKCDKKTNCNGKFVTYISFAIVRKLRIHSPHSMKLILFLLCHCLLGDFPIRLFFNVPTEVRNLYIKYRNWNASIIKKYNLLTVATFEAWVSYSWCRSIVLSIHVILYIKSVVSEEYKVLFRWASSNRNSMIRLRWSGNSALICFFVFSWWCVASKVEHSNHDYNRLRYAKYGELFLYVQTKCGGSIKLRQS